ncbi:MAG: ArsR/SmtB family transcription factor [Salinigranum sp.]
MSGLVPSDTDARETEDEEPRVLWLDDEDAADLIGSLSSGTSRAVLTALHDEPSTASELSDRVETSIQNVRHHLNNLQEAGLVRVSDTRYSVKGREMNVYAPTDDPLVVCVGREADKEGFLESLRRLVGAVAALVLVSLAVQWAFGAAVSKLSGPGVAPRVPDSVAPAAGPVLGLLPPGAAFFAGGLLVLALVAAWEYTR